MLKIWVQVKELVYSNIIVQIRLETSHSIQCNIKLSSVVVKLLPTQKYIYGTSQKQLEIFDLELQKAPKMQ